MHYIYIIQYVKDFRVYVGQSVKPNSRWAGHKGKARQYWHNKKTIGASYIHCAMAKYGIDNFTFQIIEKWENQEDANDAEVFWIGFFNSCCKGKGFNLTSGGKVLSGPDNPRYGIKGPDHPNYGKPAPNRLFTAEEEIEICKRYSKDLIPITSLSQEYNCDITTLNNLLNRNNVTILGNAVFSKGKRYSPKTEFKKGQCPHNKIFSEIEEKEICRRYLDEKLNTVQLGQVYDCNKSTIARVLDRHSIQKRKYGLTNSQKIQILNQYEKNKSSRKVAEYFGVNKSTVLRLVKQYNIKDNMLYKRID